MHTPTELRLHSYQRLVALATLSVAAGAVLTVHMYPMPDRERFMLDAFAGAFLLATLLALRYLDLHSWPSPWIVYGGIVFNCFGILAFDYSLPTLDLSPVYTIVVIVAAIISTRRAALFAAVLASVLQATVTFAPDTNLQGDILQWPIRWAVYFLAAFLVSELAAALTKQWRVAAAENKRLYTSAQENLADITRLYAISTQLAAENDPVAIPPLVVRAVAEALRAPIVSIALRNESTGGLEYAGAVGVPPDGLRVPFRENGFGMNVFRKGEPRFVEDIAGETDVSPVSRQWGYRSVACLPIGRGDKRLGILYVNYSEPHVFAPIEKSMLAILANQTATALENARLHRLERKKADELETLADLSHSLVETMDLREMYGSIERQARDAIPAADAGLLYMFDPKNLLLVPEAATGYDLETLRVVVLQPGESMVGQAFESGKALLFRGDQVARNLHSMPADHQALLAGAAQYATTPQCVMCVPLRSGDVSLGAIILENHHSTEAFGSADLQMLEAMADPAGLAIRNAQLYARGLRRATQLHAVTQVAHGMAAILNLDTLLPTVANLIHSEFGYRYVHLFIADPTRRVVNYRSGAGAAANSMALEELQVAYGRGIIGWVAENGETVLANNVLKEPRFVAHPLVPDTRAEMALPLLAAAKVIGVLDVQSEKVNAFDESDVSTLETLASQVAVAIENARFYGQMELQAQRDSLTLAFNHGYFLEQLARELERSRRDGRSLTLLMLDIDLFKEYNDRYGHVVGDEVLRATVQAIGANVKHRDLVGRWGGEEFGIALIGAGQDPSKAVAERVRRTLAAARIVTRDGRTVAPPTISQGLATFPLNADSVDALIDRADAALYRAKARGRDQVCVSGEA